MSGAIQADAQNTTGLSIDDATNAFLDAWKDGAPNEELPEDEEEENEEAPVDDTDDADTSEETPEDDAEDEESDEETEEGDEDEEDEEPKAKVLKDSDVVKVKVNGEELDVPVEKLKRLYGQEAALTQKSQEVAAKRKEVEDQGARFVAATDTLLTKAQERYAPYAQIDWLVAAKELSGEELSALRNEATKAYQDVKFLETELDGVMQTVAQERHKSLVEEAKSTLKELSDPVKGIKGFSQEMYSEMTTFAVSQGIPQDIVNNLVSAPILKLLHKAMLYDKGSKVVTKTKDKKPKKIVKSRMNSETSQKVTSNNKVTNATKRLRQEGSIDAATAAFMGKWSAD